MSFAVVEENGKTWSVVRASWLRNIKGSIFLHYPTNDKQYKETLRDDCDTSIIQSWPLLPIRVHGNQMQYADAVSFMKEKLKYVNSAAEEEALRKKKKRRANPAEILKQTKKNYDSDFESVDSNELLTLPKKSKFIFKAKEKEAPSYSQKKSTSQSTSSHMLRAQIELDKILSKENEPTVVRQVPKKQDIPKETNNCNVYATASTYATMGHKIPQNDSQNIETMEILFADEPQEPNEEISTQIFSAIASDAAPPLQMDPTPTQQNLPFNESAQTIQASANSVICLDQFLFLNHTVKMEQFMSGILTELREIRQSNGNSSKVQFRAVHKKISTLEELKQAEEKLEKIQNDKEYSNMVQNFAYHIHKPNSSYSTAHGLVHGFMNYYFAREFLMELGWSGKKRKANVPERIAFQHFKFHKKLLMDIVNTNAPHTFSNLDAVTYFMVAFFKRFHGSYEDADYI